MKGKHTLLLLFLILSIQAKCQCADCLKEPINSKEELDKRIAEILLKDFYVDSTQKVKVVITLKVDSLGEVHSAHIRWSRNLKLNDYYEISKKIESEFCIPFIYHKYEREFKNQKYVKVDYPYLED